MQLASAESLNVTGGPGMFAWVKSKSYEVYSLQYILKLQQMWLEIWLISQEIAHL